MVENIRLILLILLLLGVFVLSKKFQGWRVQKACSYVVNDLIQKGALNPNSAADLPYAKVSLYHIGLRDYRHKAVEYMMLGNIIGLSDEGKYYLKKNICSTQ